MKANYNVAVIGQTGVGKSSFINYLYGKKVVEAGVGKPVTGTGFHPIDISINGLPVTIYDSWGLEVGKEDAWMEMLNGELKNRNVNKPANEWFHSVFYCIQAGGARFQPCDEKIIKKFMEEKYNVSIILTKCDQLSLEDEEKFIKAIKESLPKVSIISVCSEEKVTRSGKTEPFGREQVQQKAFEDFFESLAIRLPLRCKSIMQGLRDEWKNEALITLKNVSFFGWNGDEVKDKLKSEYENLEKNILKKVENEINKTFSMFGNFSKKLGYPPISINNKKSTGSSFEKTDASFTWIEIPLVILAVPIAIVAGCIKGKDWKKEEIENQIDDALSKIDKLIEKNTCEIALKIKEANSKIKNQTNQMVVVNY